MYASFINKCGTQSNTDISENSSTEYPMRASLVSPAIEDDCAARIIAPIPILDPTLTVNSEPVMPSAYVQPIDSDLPKIQHESKCICLADNPIFESASSESISSDDSGSDMVIPQNISDYLRSIGADVLSFNDGSDIPPLAHLIKMMDSSYEYAKDFYHCLRVAACSPDRRFSYSFKKQSVAHFDSVSQTASAMACCGLFSEFNVNRSVNMISGKVSSAPLVINFINGNFVELIAYERARQVVENLVNSHNELESYELMRNVVIEKDGQQNELDVMIRVGCTDGRQLFFWGEIKNGKQFFNFDKYREIGIRLGLNPDRHILLHTTIDERYAAAASYFYQFYIANYNNFETKLEQMLINTVNKKQEDKAA